jgi:tetratricopeptide (TPR) repeat protein
MMKIGRAACLILLSLSAVSTSSFAADAASDAAKRAKIEALRKKAVDSYQAGNIEAAIGDYEALVALDPQNPLALKDLMWALWNKERYYEAAAQARKILALRPKDGDATEIIARLPSVTGRARIQELYKKATELAKKGDYAAATPMYRQLVALDPSDPLIAKHLLAALHRQGLHEEGLPIADKLVQAHPEDPESWSLRGEMETGLDRPEDAIKDYLKSLDIKPNQPLISLALGKDYVYVRDFDKALQVLTPLRAEDPGMASVWPLLAKAQYWTQQYSQSAVTWEKAVAAFPDHEEYSLYLAQAVYYSGQIEVGRAKMSVMKENPRAVDFLVDDALVNGKIPEAEKMMEGELRVIAPKDQSLALKLAELYQGQKQWDKMGVVLDRFLDVWPDNLNALQMKGDQLQSTERFDRALEVYQKMLKLDPRHQPALLGVANCELSLHRNAEALKAMQAARAEDPDNAHLLLKQAVFLYETGDRRKAKDALDAWIAQNGKAPVFPILLYHGLTPFEKDPLLAYPYHMTVSHFEDQMRALHEAGYTTVTASQVSAWHRNNIPPPPKSVMIAFDDGRIDSFLYADPILEKYNLKATMFAALINAEGIRPSGYASYEKMKHYQDTGRWDIESHGDRAHIYVPDGPNGEMGLFLINRLWLEGEKRLETVEAWKARIAADHESSKKKIADHLGVAPTAYAWPEGYYGQSGHTNDPETESINLELVAKSFDTVYTQDDYGLNIGTSVPTFLYRYIPESSWLGKDVLNHFEDAAPLNEMLIQRLDWAVAEGQIREAMRLLEQLRQNGVSQSILLLKESSIRYAAGDAARGDLLARKAASVDSRIDVNEAVSTDTVHGERTWTPSIVFGKDNQSRSYWILDQNLELFRTGPAVWGARLQHGEYRQYSDDIPTAIDNAAGVSLDLPFGLFQHFTGEFLQHFLNAPINQSYTLDGDIRSRWQENFTTELKGGHTIYNTAEAINDNVTKVYGDLGAQYNFGDGAWRLGGDGLAEGLSDGNHHYAGWGEVSRSVYPNLFSPGTVRIFARYSYENMNFVSPAYFSPQVLRQYSVGPDISYPIRPDLDFVGKFLPSYAQEHGHNDAYQSNFSVALTWRFYPNATLKPSIEYNSAPGYHDTLYGAEAEYRF